MYAQVASVGLVFTALNEHECALSGIGTCHDNHIVIPMQHMGRNVVGIADMAFSHNHDIVSVMVPSSVKAIGDYAFAWLRILILFTKIIHPQASRRR